MEAAREGHEDVVQLLVDHGKISEPMYTYIQIILHVLDTLLYYRIVAGTW